MSADKVWMAAKGLQALGLVVVGAGVLWSISLESERYELQGLLGGGVLFFLGWWLERRIGRR